jgi:pyruvate/2-oxoglutarate dehydrogenase complex dihydrolipoamide dehydrogenase (E3) component
MTIEHYENVVIGSGEAGKFLAWALSRQGQKSIVVERSLPMVGGACPNVACLPSKNVIHTAKVVSFVQQAASFGIHIDRWSLDMHGVRKRKDNMIDGLKELHAMMFATSGTKLTIGEARFVEPLTVGITARDGSTRTLRGDRVFLAVGTRASLPNVPGLIDAAPMTHVEALNLERVPEHLVVLGGGYVGLEFAQVMRRFGSRVTVIEHGAKLLAREDDDVSQGVQQLLAAEGIELVLKTDVVGVRGRSGDNVQLDLRSGDTTRTLEATDLLVATGRTPNTDSLDVAKGGVELDARGYIRVNDRLETTAANVWAMGECAGSPQFTHISYDDHRIVRDNLAGGNRSTRGRLIPYCLFTDPELVHTGMSETQAKAAGIHYRILRAPMTSVLRTRTHGETFGFMKVLIGDDDRILGFTAIGAETSELLAAMQTAMIGGVPYTALRDGIFPHPTTSEGLTVLFSSKPTEP